MIIPHPVWLSILIFLLSVHNFVHGISSDSSFTQQGITNYRNLVKEMFYHAYDGYLNHAYPYDELRPLTCDGQNTWGEYSLTLVDALDTLAILGNHSEFRRVSKLLAKSLNFDRDINVSVFETNIRIVGGLLSAHLLQRRTGESLSPGWPCSGPLLDLAEDVARRLLPAFDTATGMPYGTVNLRHGVPTDETSITCTAAVGTFLVEFGTLSRLTGDPVFEKTALRAIEALYNSKSEINLVGNHIDVQSGKWTAPDAGIGAGVDSYFEYLVKGAALLGRPHLQDMFQVHYKALVKYVKRDDWYMWANMQKGGITLPIFQSLEAFWPGLLSLIGRIPEAMGSLHNYQQIWRQYGFSPEFYQITRSEAYVGREGYPLRPEHVESILYLYQATKDPSLIEMAAFIVDSLNTTTRTTCGFATVKDVNDHTLANRMESFFLSETIKYLYLLFDEENFMHNDGATATIIQTPWGECALEAGGYIFNTEAHPVDAAALHCCSSKHADDAQVDQLHRSADLLMLAGLRDEMDVLFTEKKEDPSRDELFNSLLKNSQKATDQLTCPSMPFLHWLSGSGEIFRYPER